MSKTRRIALRLVLSILLLALPAAAGAQTRGQPLADSTLYLPQIGSFYSVDIVLNGSKTEYRFKYAQRHFMTLVDDAGKDGTLNLRPHPGRDINGWGSSWYAQPFLADAEPRHALIESVAVHPDRISVQARGSVPRGAASTYGTWRSTLSFTYDQAEHRIRGSGTYEVSLAGALVGPHDLNLFRMASNYLEHVPLLPNGIGDTGDMSSAIFVLDDAQTNVWAPPDDHCPQDVALKLAINVVGQYNNVNTAALGADPIAPAYKPSLQVVLSSTQQTIGGMIVCGFYDELKNKDFAADNVGIHAVVRSGTAQTQFHYRVDFESRPLPDECLRPAACEPPAG